MQTLRWLGKLMLHLVPMAVLLWGCALTPRPSPYQVLIPTLQAQPREIPCNAPEATTCLVLRKDDWQKVIRELKAACLALGGSKEKCQAG